MGKYKNKYINVKWPMLKFTYQGIIRQETVTSWILWSPHPLLYGSVESKVLYTLW